MKPLLPDGSVVSGRRRIANHGKHRALVWNRGEGFSWELQSRLPYHALKIAANADTRRDAERATIHRYCQEIDFEGLKAALRRAGRGWFALTPKVMTDGSVRFWLNPTEQQRNHAGWFSVEALRQWIAGEGPIPMR